MADYQELVKQFNPLRRLLGQIYIYGHHTRKEFSQYSPRAYDNWRRRFESLFTDLAQFEYGDHGKILRIQQDLSSQTHNPLASVYELKSFTPRQCELYFLILHILQDSPALTITALTRALSEYCITDEQQVRRTVKMLHEEGILNCRTLGKAYCYTLSPIPVWLSEKNFPLLYWYVSWMEHLLPFGEVALYWQRYMEHYTFQQVPFAVTETNPTWLLDDIHLFTLLPALETECAVSGKSYSTKKQHTFTFQGIFRKIVVSSWTGRRYLLLEGKHGLQAIRLDQLHSLQLHPEKEIQPQISLSDQLDTAWMLPSSEDNMVEEVHIRLSLDERESEFVPRRLERELPPTHITKINENTYDLHLTLTQPQSLLPWLRTHMGRIQSIQSTSGELEQKFYQDVQLLQQMYAD